MTKESVLKPSVEKPWKRYIPEALFRMINHPMTSLYKYVEERCPGKDITAISYYDSEIKWEKLFKERDLIAKGLKALGVKENDQIPSFLHITPEFFSLLFAIEKIGASIICRVNDLKEDVEAASKSQGKIMFVHDFLSQEDLEVFKNQTSIEKVIIVSPSRSCLRCNMPEHVQKNLKNNYYHGTPLNDKMVMTWDELLELGSEYEGEVDAEENIFRPLYRVYTSGSTGPSKQVIHCAKTMLDNIIQLNFYSAKVENGRPAWIHTSIPPAMIASVVCMTLPQMTSNQLLILDPFVDAAEVDQSFLLYKPNAWSLIPMFLDVIVNSNFIDDDTDLSFFMMGGVGAEALNNKQIRTATSFFKAHKSSLRLSVCYGSTEAGACMTLPFTPTQFFNNDVGIPAPLLTMGIFKFNSDEELSYNEIGEICKTGAGNMLGYDNQDATKKVLIQHSDGQVWLHTGDKGYMKEDGSIFVLSRGEAFRYDGGDLMILPMENRIADANIDEILDAFFVNVPDPEHNGYFLPYLYVVLKEGALIEDIESRVNNALEEFQRPFKIIQIDKRPFFHFKTNRIGLAKEEFCKLYDAALKEA